MSEYKILLGTKLDTSGLKDDISKLNDKHKIKIGVDLKVNDIKTRISDYNKNTNNIKVKLGVKLDTADIKKQIDKIGDLNIGNGKGVAIPLNTESLEQSLKEVKNIVESVRKSFGSIDDESGLKSLLSSVNQIANALDKATDESNGLVKSLNELGKKDFSVNIGLDIGNKKNNNMIAYGRAARKQVIPELERQAAELEKILGGQQATLKKLTQHQDIGFDIYSDFNDFNSDSAIKKMEALEKYINSMKKLASIDNIKLDGFNEIHKDASKLIDDIAGVESAIDKAEDIPEKLKGVFGGSIDVDGLSGVLEPIKQDLQKIGEFIGRLDDNNSIDSLTASFNKLSETLDKLMTNAKLVQDVLGNVSGVSVKTGVGDSNIDDVVQSEKERQRASTETANTVIQNENRQQQEFKETIDGVSDVVQEMRRRLSNINIDDSSIDSITKDLKELGLTIDKISIKDNADNLDITVKGTNEMKEAVTVMMQFDKEAEQLSTAGKTISYTFDKVANAANKIKNKLTIGDYSKELNSVEIKSDSLSKKSEKLEAAIDNVKNAFVSMKNVAKNGSDEELIRAAERYEKSLKEVNNQLDIQIKKEQLSAKNTKLTDEKAIFSNKIDAWLKKNSAAVEKFGDKMLELKAKIESCDKAELDHLKNKFKQLDMAAEAAGLKTQTLGDRLRTQFKKYSAYLSVYEVIMYTTQAIKDMFNEVVAIDTAMTELKKVTDETGSAYDEFLNNAGKRAQELGTTIDSLVTSTADFARLGFGFKDAQGLAEVANIYAVVGDEIDSVETATQSLISTMTAFSQQAGNMSDTDFAMDIIDKFNEVSNNFAISSGGIGEALQRSASSMAAANNTIDETIALITAANTVVQDPASVGTAFKTISMRMKNPLSSINLVNLEI